MKIPTQRPGRGL